MKCNSEVANPFREKSVANVLATNSHKIREIKHSNFFIYKVEIKKDSPIFFVIHFSLFIKSTVL